MTEEEALQRLRAQDTAVLHWLIGQYNRYVASIIRAVLGKTCREEDAEELTADVFYSVFRRAGSISPGKLQAYLGAAARNRAKDFLRKQKPLEADLDELTLPDGEGTAPEAELLRRERQMRVKEAIFSMEPVDLISVKAVAAKCVVFFIDIHSYIKYTVHCGLPLYAVTPVALPSIVSIQSNPRPYNGEVTSYYLFSKISISADHNAPDFSEAGIESIRFRSGISK